MEPNYSKHRMAEYSINMQASKVNGTKVQLQTCLPLGVLVD